LFPVVPLQELRLAQEQLERSELAMRMYVYHVAGHHACCVHICVTVRVVFGFLLRRACVPQSVTMYYCCYYEFCREVCSLCEDSPEADEMRKATAGSNSVLAPASEEVVEERKFRLGVVISRLKSGTIPELQLRLRELVRLAMLCNSHDASPPLALI
jgi:hypothetical protein